MEYSKVVTGVGVAAIIPNSKNFVLLGKRKGSIRSGKWDLVGGFVEPNESLEEAITREVKEETRLIVESTQYFCSFPGQYGDRQILVIFFICKVLGKPQKSEEVEDYKYFNTIPDVFDSSRKALSVWFQKNQLNKKNNGVHICTP